MKTSKIMGYEVEEASSVNCIRDISDIIDRPQRNCMWLACLNPHSYVVARKDYSFRQALKSAQWLIPDGVGIVIASRILGHPTKERVTGFDIFVGVMSELNRTGGSVFFLGSTELTLSMIAQQLPKDYPNVRLAGVYSPPFVPEFSHTDTEAMIAAVAASNADVLWVGMTAPKQEKWIASHRDRLPVKFAGAIGAVFDFYTGQVKRSHPIFQRLGLEWLPRLIHEPRRLWKRMFVSAPIFLHDVAKAVIEDRLTRLKSY